MAIASISLPLELSLVLVAWAIVAVLGLWVSGLGTQLFNTYAGWITLICATALLSVLGLRLAWPLLSRRPQFARRLGQLQAMLHLRLRRRPLIRSCLAYVVLNTFHGLGLWLMLAGVGYAQVVSPAAAIGANAAGWLLGFFAIGIPGGIGVREAGAALVLSPLLPWPEATLAAACWRVLQIVAELVALCPGFLSEEAVQEKVYRRSKLSSRKKNHEKVLLYPGLSLGRPGIHRDPGKEIYPY